MRFTYRNKYYIPLIYPRKKRGYRFSFMKRRRVPDNFERAFHHDMRQKPSMKSRLTYIQYNANARRHNNS
jgi:hypothetical protein